MKKRIWTMFLMAVFLCAWVGAFEGNWAAMAAVPAGRFDMAGQEARGRRSAFPGEFSGGTAGMLKLPDFRRGFGRVQGLLQEVWGMGTNPDSGSSSAQPSADFLPLFDEAVQLRSLAVTVGPEGAGSGREAGAEEALGDAVYPEAAVEVPDRDPTRRPEPETLAPKYRKLEQDETAMLVLEEKIMNMKRVYPESVYEQHTTGPEDPVEEVQKRSIPILLYHNIDETASDGMTISRATFESHMQGMNNGGYTPISFGELIAFVETGAELPEKPVIITFDDGYSSNYEIAFPVLRALNMKATIFPIGITVGWNSYKDTGVSINPHFDRAEMAEMAESGLIAIQSHTYDMHQVVGLDDPAKFRTGVLRREEETQEEYRQVFFDDVMMTRNLLEETTGQPVEIFAYPFGVCTDQTEAWLQEAGFRVTLLTGQRGNVVEKGKPEGLLRMNRYTMTEDDTNGDLLKLLAGESDPLL